MSAKAELLRELADDLNHGIGVLKAAKKLREYAYRLDAIAVSDAMVERAEYAYDEALSAANERGEKISKRNRMRAALESVLPDEQANTRYEYVRKLNPAQFAELWNHCLTNDVRFDDEVDRRASAKGDDNE